MIWDDWPLYWESGLAACKAHGGTLENYGIRPLKIGPPTTESSVIEVETKLNQKLPESLRRVLRGFSASVEYRWYLPEGVAPPAPFDWIIGCICAWDLELLIALEEERRGWIATNFPDPNNAYDAVWHHKLAFMEVGNGDQLALDLSFPDTAPVVYLSHDGGEGHGYRLADDFEDFINRWSLLGCPGPVDWQMAPFISSPKSGLQPHSENARQWRAWFGLEIGSA